MKPWANSTNEAFGFRVTIERRRPRARGVELHTFPCKAKIGTYAIRAAHHKQGFLRVVQIDQLDREQWQAAFGENCK